MAGALLQQLWAGDEPLEVLSAGTNTVHGLAATAHAVTTMQERGIDLGAHRSQPITPQLLQSVDLVLTMTAGHREALRYQYPEHLQKIQTLAEYAGSSRDVSDPFGGPLEAYQQTAGALIQLLTAAVARMQRKE